MRAVMIVVVVGDDKLIWMYMHACTDANRQPGIAGAAAIAQVLFGDFNPAGRTPGTLLA